MRMTIGKKLGGGFGAVVILLIVVATVGWFSITNLWDTAEHMTEEFDHLDLVMEIKALGYEMMEAEMSYLLIGDEKFIKKI